MQTLGICRGVSKLVYCPEGTELFSCLLSASLADSARHILIDELVLSFLSKCFFAPLFLVMRLCTEKPLDILQVDLNRNFGYKWAEDLNIFDPRPASGISCLDTYHGPEAFSEPETKAIRDFIMARRHKLVVCRVVRLVSRYI